MMGSRSSSAAGAAGRPGPGPALVDVSGVGRRCARPGCSAPAGATLGFAYAERIAVLEPLADERMPQAYDLCVDHAGATTPPRGWALEDRRPRPSSAPEGTSAAGPGDEGFGGDRTVAVLAAALRAVPDTPVSEPAAAASRVVDVCVQGTTPSPVGADQGLAAERGSDTPAPPTRPVLAARERGR